MAISRGDFYVKKHLDENGKSRLKIVDADLNGDFLIFPYENSSPLVEKFENLMSRTVESGLMIYQENKQLKSEFSDMDLIFRKIQDQYILQRFLIILVLGYLVSLLTFISELLINRYLKK